jgi:hypothetical protein
MLVYLATEGRRNEIMADAERERLAARVFERLDVWPNYLTAAETRRLDILDAVERDWLVAQVQLTPIRRTPMFSGMRNSLGSWLIKQGERLNDTHIKAPMAET